jgi:hypothetical protein
MLGQSADLVLRGALPHVDYEEPYTGGLSWLYAQLFRFTRVDLLNVRWLLFVAASWVAWLIYAIVRRYLNPTSAALATWVAIGWSFPNYFAGLPSWWLLVCALACLWALIRYAETGRWRFIVVAGMVAGIAMAFKQTGIYLLVALVLSLLYRDRRSDRASSGWAGVERRVRWSAAVTAIAVAAAILVPRIFAVEGLYLFCPAAACALILVLPFERRPASSRPHSPLAVVGVAMAAAALPLAFLLFPYVIHHRIWDFVYGSIVLPRRRLAFASMEMPGKSAVVTGLPLLVLTWLAASSRPASWSVLVKSLLWAATILVPIAAVWNVFSYQLVWQSSRLYAALLPVGICWLLASGRVQRPEQRPVLFASAAMLAWASLNQFPFAAPIYFCYVAPLAVVTTIIAAGTGSDLGPVPMVPCAVMLVLFAVLCANRGDIHALGVLHDPARFNMPLKLSRAHLNVSDSDASVYRRLVFSIEHHLHGGQLIAGPDCPEVYFLSGLSNPSGRLFEFFSNDSTDPGRNADLGVWLGGDVVVLNHRPSFSPAPSDALAERLRREFPYGEDIDRFEIRWR